MRRNETAAVEAAAVGFRLEHPPLAQILLELLLRNTAADPRWFLLPGELGAPLAGEHAIFGAAPVEVEGRGRAVVVRFEGTEPIQALLLPGNAEVRLHGWPVPTHGPLPEGSFRLEAVVASVLEVEGTSVATWIGADPTSDSSVDASWDDATRMRSRYTPGYATVPVKVSEERRFELELTLPRQRPEL